MFEVRLHNRVVTFLKELEKGRARKMRKAIDKVAENPFVHRAGCDIKKLSGKRNVYRLRVGDYRFIYVVDRHVILLIEAFQREKGYR